MARSWPMTYCVELLLDLARRGNVGEERLGRRRGVAAPGRGSTGRARCTRRRCRRRRGLRRAGRRRGSSCGRTNRRRSSCCRRSCSWAYCRPPSASAPRPTTRDVLTRWHAMIPFAPRWGRRPAGQIRPGGEFGSASVLRWSVRIPRHYSGREVEWAVDVAASCGGPIATTAASSQSVPPVS